MTPSLAAALLLAGALVGLAVAVDERRRRAPALAALAAAPDPAPEVTVLLPVRDEEGNVLACVDTLLAQTVRPRVVVVDDGSTDRTAALVAARTAALAADRVTGEPRLALVEAGPLPDGWHGKIWALAAGSREASTPWLLSTDADTRHHPEALARALATAAVRGLDAVSLAGRQEARGLGEGLLVPAVFALLDTRLGDWGPTADGGGPAVANGQFILLRRAALERAGGFAAIRGQLLDDVALARRLRETGAATGFLRAPELLSVRMYRGTAEAVRGWRRGLGAIFGPAPGATAAALALLVTPPLAIAAALAAGRPVEAALLWAAGAVASAVLRAGSGHAPLLGLLYPLDALLLASVLGTGVAGHRRGRPVTWKGRQVTSR